MMKIFYVMAVFSAFFVLEPLYAQEDFLLKGLLLNSETGEPVPNANITISGTSTGTSSRPDGTFGLKLSKGLYQINFSAIGFVGFAQFLNVPDDISIPLVLRFVPQEMELDNIDVFGKYFISD